jgi:hypothetical protein
MTFSCWTVLTSAFLLSPTALGAEDWILTTADFRTERVLLRGMSAAEVSVIGQDGQGRSVGMAQLLQLERAQRPRGTSGKFTVILENGDQVSGEPRGLAGATLLWSNPTLGELRIPLADAAAVVRSSRKSELDPKRPTDDVVTLMNGDTVRGIITSVTETSISLQGAGGDSIALPMESIVTVEFAPITGAAASIEPPVRAFRVTLADETVCVAPAISVSEKRVELSLADGSTRSMDLDAVVSIEQMNGPVVWLSSRRPSDSVQTPLFDTASPARMNQSIDGGPIRFGQRTFSRGIGVHAYSRLSWPIDQGYLAFRTQYAIDGPMPYANVTVRIRLDDRVVHEQKDFRAGVLAPLIVLDTDNARLITLEVDYGQSYDVQDRFNWIEPALLKQKPAPPASRTTSPATQPATQPGL